MFISICGKISKNLFTGIRRSEIGYKWKIKCFNSDKLDELIAMPESTDIQADARSYVPCVPITTAVSASYKNDAGVTDYFSSTRPLQLAGQAGADGGGPNICNPDRIANIVTVLLAKSVGLKVDDIVSNFVYDEAEDFEFPEHKTKKPSQTYEPSEAGMKQIFWSIISQYTNTTEPALRSKETKWCHYHALAAWSHSRKEAKEDTCQSYWDTLVNFRKK